MPMGGPGGGRASRVSSGGNGSNRGAGVQRGRIHRDMNPNNFVFHHVEFREFGMHERWNRDRAPPWFCPRTKLTHSITNWRLIATNM